MKRSAARLIDGLVRHTRAVVWLSILAWMGTIGFHVATGRSPRVGWVGTLFLIVVAASLLAAWADSRRRMTIREGALPSVLKRKLRQAFPHLEERDADLVERGFRQFFLACARSNGKRVAMPSKAVDAYWHAFILDTKSYAAWCDRTLGRFLHHAPPERLGRSADDNDALRRAWLFACREEAINPRKPTRLPLLFALDAKLAIAGGIAYLASSRYLLPPEGGSSEVDAEWSFGSDFADESFEGDAGGMGGADGGGGGDGDGGGGGD